MTPVSVSRSESERNTKPDRKYLTEDEVERLLVRTSGPTDKLLIQLGLSLGCRVSEIVSLRILNINGQVIRIWDEKKDEDRIVVTDAATAEAIQVYLRDYYLAPHGLRREFQVLFPFTAKTVNRIVKRAFGAAEVSKGVPWRWHTLRHTYIRRTLDLTKDRGLQHVIEQTGDSPATILRIYGVPSLEDRLKVADETAATKGAPR